MDDIQDVSAWTIGGKVDLLARWGSSDRCDPLGYGQLVSVRAKWCGN